MWRAVHGRLCRNLPTRFVAGSHRVVRAEHTSRGDGSAARRPRDVKPGATKASNPWDELFAGPSAFPTTEPDSRGTRGFWLSEEEASQHNSHKDTDNATLPRSVLFSSKREDGMPEDLQRSRRDRYNTTSLTHAEMQQFKRIFELLESETGSESTSAPAAPELEEFALRNTLRPQKMTARGGGVGTRFEVLREGIGAETPQEEIEVGMDEVWEHIQALPDAQSVWQWADENVWGVDKSAYGMQTALYAPTLHMLLVALRDRFQAPHAALALHENVRSLGPHSAALGCTAALYVEVIRTNWLCFRDAYAVLDAVREARAVGVLSARTDRSHSAVRGEDEALRAQIDRIRDELRRSVMSHMSGDVAAGVYLGRMGGGQRLSAADEDLLAVANELGTASGHPARIRPAARQSGIDEHGSSRMSYARPRREPLPHHSPQHKPQAQRDDKPRFVLPAYPELLRAPLRRS